MEDTNVLGHQIQEGMIVQANVWELHYDKEVWGQDPTTFEPERYDQSLDLYPIKFETENRLFSNNFLNNICNL